MIVCEFNGIPGCGKTTIAELLIVTLKKEGIEARLYDRAYSSNSVVRKMQWAMRILLCITTVPRRTIKAVFKLAGNTKKRYVWDCLINYARVRKTADVDIVIMDQGVIQSILSIIHENELFDSISNNDAIIEYLLAFKDYLSSCLIINCSAPATVCIQRCKERNKAALFGIGSRLENETEESFIKQDKQLNDLREMIRPLAYKSINIDTTQDSECLVQTIVNEVRELNEFYTD